MSVISDAATVARQIRFRLKRAHDELEVVMNGGYGARSRVSHSLHEAARQLTESTVLLTQLVAEFQEK